MLILNTVEVANRRSDGAGNWLVFEEGDFDVSVGFHHERLFLEWRIGFLGVGWRLGFDNRSGRGGFDHGQGGD